jgi:hypothetical protein
MNSSRLSPGLRFIVINSFATALPVSVTIMFAGNIGRAQGKLHRLSLSRTPRNTFLTGCGVLGAATMP